MTSLRSGVRSPRPARPLWAIGGFWAIAGFLATSGVARADAPPAPATPAEIKPRLDAVEASLGETENRLSFVEKEYVQRKDETDEQIRNDRFAKGSAEFADGDYQGASVLFYDLVGMEAFKRDPNYDEGLYFLAESLYQQTNYLGARTYFRELLNLHASHYRQALARYLEISGKLNEFSGIEQYVDSARDAQGRLPPEVAYVYGKWIFRRSDLPLQERIQRAGEVLRPISGNTTSEYHLQANYLLGVLAVEQGNYDDANARFLGVVKETGRDDRERVVQELAHLALGRIAYEQGKYSEAIDAYQEVDRDSDNFVPALYEIAWVFVKKGEFDKALKSADLLLLMAPDSVLAPEAKILEGHLYLKLAKYADAAQTYKEVINTYAPVRDEVDALLKLHDDPVKYFNQLLAQNEKDFNVTSLLPPAAAKWATTQQEVSEALRMTGDLGASRRGVDDSNEIADSIVKSINEKGANAFPVLQEGFSKAEAVDATLTKNAETLLAAQQDLLVGKIGDLQSQLDAARRERESLETRFRTLPKTEAEVAARRARFQKKLDEVDKGIFALQIQVDGMNAILNAIEKWVADTRSQRKDDPAAEKDFLSQVKDERAVITELGDALTQIHSVVRDEALRSGNVTGDEEVRSRYQAALDKEQGLLSKAQAQLGPNEQSMVSRVNALQQRVGADRARIASAKAALQSAVAFKAESIRHQVDEERTKLRAYSGEVDTVSSNARDLVGRIAFDSFKRVRKQFYDLVLKADVGMVDVAWTKKQDDTDKIQELSREKDHQLKTLDDEFKEVLKDVD